MQDLGIDKAGLGGGILMFSFTVDVRYSDLDGVPTYLQTITNTEVKLG